MSDDIDLRQFTGTTQYFRHITGMLYTDGVQYVAEKCGAYWLIDAIASYQIEDPVKKVHFQIWKLKVNQKEHTALLSMELDNGVTVVQQEIDYTDFPLSEITMWLIDGILILPSEY